MDKIGKLFAICLLLVGCTTKNTTETDLIIIEDGFHFYTIGDWGRNGQYGQRELAVQMNTSAGILEPEFIVSTGDNFYVNGIASVDDPYWISSYENVYDGANLFCDWFVTLGNHDYRGNAQAQIDYTNKSRRWNMPARYFLKDVTTDMGATARFVFLDTSPLNDDYYAEEKYRDKVMEQDTTAQLMWLDSVLRGDFDWKIVVGHHPLYTGGKRKEVPNAVRNHLEPLFRKHGVHVYLAGHEHDLQHIRTPDNIDHIVSGAGSEIRPTGKMDYSLFAEATNGFVSTTITSDSLYHQYLNERGKVIYSFATKK